jgi:hypothetical protein
MQPAGAVQLRHPGECLARRGVLGDDVRQGRRMLDAAGEVQPSLKARGGRDLGRGPDRRALLPQRVVVHPPPAGRRRLLPPQLRVRIRRQDHLLASSHGPGLTDLATDSATAIFTDLSLANEFLYLRKAAAEAAAAGVISSADGAAWMTQLEQTAAGGRFFSALSVFGVSGRKP